MSENTATEYRSGGQISVELDMLNDQREYYLNVRDRLANICEKIGVHPNNDQSKIETLNEVRSGIVGRLRDHRDSMNDIHKDITQYLGAIEDGL